MASEKWIAKLYRLKNRNNDMTYLVQCHVKEMSVLVEGILENKPGKEDCPIHEDTWVSCRVAMKSFLQNTERTQK